MGKLQAQNLYNGPDTHVSPDITTNSVVKESHPTGDKSLYPKWMYHASNSPVIVETAEEHQALGGGWQESPVEKAE